MEERCARKGNVLDTRGSGIKHSEWCFRVYDALFLGLCVGIILRYGHGGFILPASLDYSVLERKM
jgi:hypothetical protein